MTKTLGSDTQVEKRVSLKDYYQNLEHRPMTPKQKLRKELMDAFGVTEMSVSRWLNGSEIPARDKWEKISEITDIPVEDLFPDTGENNIE